MIALTLPDGTYNRYKPDRNGIREIYEQIAGYLEPDYACGRNTELVSSQNHMIAADAEGWCELACIGESYEDSRIPGLTISIEEE